MTQTSKFTLLFILLFNGLAYSQDTVSLISYLEDLETKFPYTFSYKDNDLQNQIIEKKQVDIFNTALAHLEQNSLFKYTVLEDNTITINKKETLISRCLIITSSINEFPLKQTQINTPYQSLTTDDEGKITLTIQSLSDTFSIDSNGFETKLIDAKELLTKSCSTIPLLSKIETLNTVTLRNYFAKGIFKNNDGSLTINYDDFDILPGLIEPDVLLTLQALPGIQSVDETVSFLNIRGGTNDQNLILWDGIKMYQNGHFFGLISAFNPFLTETVHLTKNGTSAAIGDGVSGLIDMQSEKELNTKLKASLGLNLISADAFVDVPLGKLGSIQVSGRKSINNVYESPTYDSYFDKAFQNTEVTTMGGNILPTSDDDFSFFDVGLRALIRSSDKDFFRVNLLILGNQLEFRENASFEGDFQSLQSDLVQNNFSGGFYYQREWNAKWTSDFQFYGTAYELQAANQDIVNNQQLFQENDVLESGIKVTTTHAFNEKFSGTIGYQFNETGITNRERINNPFFERIDKQVLLTNSLFAETTYQPSPQTVLNIGVRANHIDKFNTVLMEPRLSFSHEFLKYFTFEILGELKSQTASQIVDFQNDFLGVENRRWVLSKPDQIPIIKGKQLATGISFNRKGWLLSAEPYLKEVTGITSQSQGFQNQFTNEKTDGSYTVKGIDFLLNKRFKKINTWLGYSYAENDYTFEEFTPSMFHNNIDIRHTLTYGINYSLDAFTISAGFNWHTGKPTTTLRSFSEAENGELDFAAPNQDNLQDYVRVDLSGTYRFNFGKKMKGFVGLSVWNLLDSRNVVNQFFRINNESMIEQVEDIALRFTPNLSLRVSF